MVAHLVVREFDAKGVHRTSYLWLGGWFHASGSARLVTRAGQLSIAAPVDMAFSFYRFANNSLCVAAMTRFLIAHL